MFISIVLNFYLFKKVKEIYVREQMIHLMPINTSKNNYFEEQSMGDSSSVILLGDSRIKNWTPKINITEAKIINFGIGGETTTQLLYRVEKEIDTYIGKVIIIQTGINDLKTIGVFKEEKSEIMSNCFNNIIKISTLLTSKNKEVILLTIFPNGKVSFLRRFVWDKSIPQAIHIVNEKIRNINLPNVSVIDCDIVLSGQNELINPDYSIDALHMNNKGYEVLNNLLYPIVINHLR